MLIAFVDSSIWIAAGFHAAIFVAVVVVLWAAQWLLQRRGHGN